jgi:hypothetical protein
MCSGRSPTDRSRASTALGWSSPESTRRSGAGGTPARQGPDPTQCWHAAAVPTPSPAAGAHHTGRLGGRPRRVREVKQHVGEMTASAVLSASGRASASARTADAPRRVRAMRSILVEASRATTRAAGATEPTGPAARRSRHRYRQSRTGHGVRETGPGRQRAGESPGSTAPRRRWRLGRRYRRRRLAAAAAGRVPGHGAHWRRSGGTHQCLLSHWRLRLPRARFRSISPAAGRCGCRAWAPSSRRRSAWPHRRRPTRR